MFICHISAGRMGAGVPGLANNLDILRAFQLLQFISGGVAHVVVLGLLLAGVSIPSAFMKLVPKWLVLAGLNYGSAGRAIYLKHVFPATVYAHPARPFSRFCMDGRCWVYYARQKEKCGRCKWINI